MSLRHILNLQRQVYLGGRRVPFTRRRIGGHWYTVGPLSLMRFLQLMEALGSAGLATLGRAPIPTLTAMAPILVKGRILPGDLKRISPDQLVALWEAVSQTNDLDYLASQFKPPDKPSDGITWDYVDAMDLVCEARPANTIDSLKAMAAMQFFAILDAIAKKAEARQPKDGDDDGYREITPEELARLAQEPPDA